MPRDLALPQTLFTDRLAGRPPMERDGPLLGAILQDPVAMRWLSADGRPVHNERVAWLLDRLAAHWQAHDFGPRLFFLRDTDGKVPEPGLEPRNRFVGWCGLRHQFVDGQPEIELLYALRPPVWRRGFGSEMAAAGIEEGFAALGATSVVAFTLPDNLGSRGVMERCGMTYERGIRHAGLPHVLYRKLNPHPTRDT